MEDKEWVAEAERLREGTTRKVGHSCGAGDCLQLNHKRDGYTAYCHRCGYKSYHPKPAETLTEKLARIARMRAAEDSVAASPSLPLPAERDPRTWPLEARVWLYKAAISNAEIETLGFYWNPHLARVVLPVRDELGEVIYWQARTLDKGNPRKYTNPRVDKRRLIAKYGDGPALVLTEDLLSAYRVSRAGYAAWSLLGTKLNDWTAADIIRSGKPVLVALDPDKAGQDNAAKIIKTLRAYGASVRNVVFPKDPKLMSREAILYELGNYAPPVVKDAGALRATS